MRLFHREDVLTDGSRIYDYLATIERPEGTKYEGQFANFYEKVLIRYGIDVKGKSVLDISGGPGFFARDLGKIAGHVVMTEFNLPSVEFARSKLGVEAFLYDFNSHVISDCTSDRFDIVMIRYAINFCTDIPRFLHQLKKVLHPNALVLVCGFVLPSLGVCLQWQFDDYTYPILYNPETMEKLFAQAGFSIRNRYDGGAYRYNRDLRWPQALMNSLYGFANRLHINRSFNRDPLQKNACMIFTLQDAHSIEHTDRRRCMDDN
jgi:ubiquinone/menaquinone biosynthesis C-methylase UbiE